MTSPLSLGDLLLLLLTALAFAVGIGLIRALSELRRASAELTKTLEAVRPMAERLRSFAEEAEKTAVSLRGFADEGRAVASDLSSASAKVRDVVEEGAEQVRSLLAPMKYISLLVAGLQAGLETVARMRGRCEGDETDPARQEAGPEDAEPPSEGGAP